MEPTTEPTVVWERSRKSLEELAVEQGYTPPTTPWPGIEGFMDDEEWEAFRTALEEWREEDQRETNK